MHILDATKLCQLVCDQYGKDAARLVPLSDGREFAVFIKQPRQYFCFCFADWTAYRQQDKKQAQQKRKRAGREVEVLHAIDQREAFSLAM